jgi:hypothetical protein
MILRVVVVLALVDAVATASIWSYLVQSRIDDLFLFTISGVWVLAICALVGLLIYVSAEIRGSQMFAMLRGN